MISVQPTSDAQSNDLGKKAGDREMKGVETAAPSHGGENYFLGRKCIYCPAAAGHRLVLGQNDRNN